MQRSWGSHWANPIGRPLWSPPTVHTGPLKWKLTQWTLIVYLVHARNYNSSQGGLMCKACFLLSSHAQFSGDRINNGGVTPPTGWPGNWLYGCKGYREEELGIWHNEEAIYGLERSCRGTGLRQGGTLASWVYSSMYRRSSELLPAALTDPERKRKGEEQGIVWGTPELTDIFRRPWLNHINICKKKPVPAETGLA